MADTLLQPIIDQHFISIKEPREPDGLYHPSSLTGCDRQAVYERTGTEKTDDTQVRNIRIMARGTQMHSEVQEMMAAKFPGYLPEVKLRWGMVTGTCDGLLPVADGLQAGVMTTMYELHEYKSIGPLGKKYKGAMPKPEHIMQARIYHAALLDMGYMLDQLIRIVYFDRDDWSVNEYEVAPWTTEEVEDFLAHLENLEDHAQNGTLPDRKAPDYWLCRYCPFRTRCWNQDGENVRGMSSTSCGLGGQ